MTGQAAHANAAERPARMAIIEARARALAKLSANTGPRRLRAPLSHIRPRRELTPRELLEEFRGDVALIAAKPADQVYWLRSTGFPVDEIADQFDDGMLVFMPRLRRENLIAPELEAALARLDRHLAKLSEEANAARWTVDALRNDPAWEQSRQQAQAILPMIDAILPVDPGLPISDELRDSR